MGWSEEVHTSRLTDASVRAKRQARLRRTNKLPEAEGSATPGVLLAAAGAVFATIILQHNQHQERVKGVIGSILDNFAQFLPHPPARGRTTGYASPRDKTATATTSGRPFQPISAPQAQQTSSSQGQSHNKSKKKRKHRHK